MYSRWKMDENTERLYAFIKDAFIDNGNQPVRLPRQALAAMYQTNILTIRRWLDKLVSDGRITASKQYGDAGIYYAVRK